MSTFLRNRAVALGVAGAIALGSVVSTAPAFAGPVPANTAAVKQALPDDVIDIGHRGWRGPGPWVAGAALGIIGGVIASQAYRDNYYYDEGYAYGPYPYAAPYPAQPYYGGYAPYRGCDNASTC
jgi:hypothetical protein